MRNKHKTKILIISVVIGLAAQSFSASIEGEKTFYVEVLADNDLIVNQPVAVPIVKKGFSLPSIGGSNWHLWAIGALNVILVIFIIVIAIRIARK